MVTFVHSFSGMSVPDLPVAKAFYQETLGLALTGESMGLDFDLPGGGQLFLYEKEDHQPASYTALNLVTDDINATVDELGAKGVKFERYDNMPGSQDERGILRGKAANMGPDIAWFKDPAGNILAVLEQ
jgi:catechol 2,3-dioxygenase-like lactoylglutathione lyase family enzyme